MKPGTVNSQRMDDLVFENRNKEYGAYVIRQTYSRNLKTGFLASIIVAAIVVLLIKVIVLFISTKMPLVSKLSESDGIVITITPSIIPMEKPAITQPPILKSTAANLIPIVTSQQVETVSVLDKSVVTTTVGTETGTSTVLVESTGVTLTPAVIESPKIVDFAEVMPQYEGGLAAMMKFIQHKTHYPQISEMNNIEGTVYVGFVVNSEGRIVNVKVLKGISADCDQEAVRVISMMPRWKPGMQNKMPVSVRMVLPLKFKLNE